MGWVNTRLKVYALLETILSKFGLICATGNAFVRLIVGREMALFLGSRSERGGARRAPTKRVSLKFKKIPFTFLGDTAGTLVRISLTG